MNRTNEKVAKKIGIRKWFWKTYHSRTGMNMKMKADDIMRLAYDWKSHTEAYEIKYSLV